MTTGPTPGDPADEDEAIVERVAARMRAAGREVVTDGDPEQARHQIIWPHRPQG